MLQVSVMTLKLNNLTMDKKRIGEIDIIKGLGILIIAAIHLVYRTKSGAADYVLRSLGWSLISVFFMMSGYFFTAGKRKVIQSWLHRLRYRVLPVVLAEFLLLVIGGVYCAFVHGYDFSDWLHDVAVTFLRPEWTVRISGEWGNGGVLYDNLSPAWFLYTLIWTELVFFPIAAWCEGGKRKVRWWTAVIVLTAVQVPLYIFVSPVSWQLQLIPLFTVFMLVGAKLRVMRAHEREWTLNPAATAGISLVCFAVVIGLFLLGADESYYRGQIGFTGGFDVLLIVVQLPFGALAFFALSKLIMRVRGLSYVLQWIGQSTVLFLMCHCFYGMIAADVMQTYIKPGPMWYVENAGLSLTPEVFWKSVAGTAIAIICCVLTRLVLDRIRSIKKRCSDN